MRFASNVIVVTGGGSGIGLQIASDLYDEGATVCLLGRQGHVLEQAREALERRRGAGRVLHFACDVSSPEATTEVFDALKHQGHLVSSLVNNAGINPSRHRVGETSDQAWQQTLDVNLTGAFNCSRAAIAHMLTLGAGSIVNIASIAGIMALPQRASYMASKWGLVGLSRSMAIDYAAHKIRVNTVCPGYVETPLTKPFLETLTSEQREALITSHALERLGTPNDIAAAVLFLLSDAASWITGVELPVDGGCTLKGLG